MEIIEVLLRAGSNAHGDSDERIPLFWAVRRGNPSIVRRLLQAGADPHVKGAALGTYGNEDEKISILVQLVKSEVPEAMRTEIEKLLWDAGVKPAFFYACFGGLSFSVQEWLKTGVDIDAKFQNKTPLMWAILGARSKAVQMLITAGADLKAVDEKAQTVWDILEREKLTPQQYTNIKRALNTPR
jgi:ankyrin repeat protein